MVFNFHGFHFKEGNLHGVSRMPGATNETPILFIPSREGGSESIYWSKSDATNGNDLYLPCGLKGETSMKKIGTYLLSAALFAFLAACAPKRYERKHSPVGLHRSKNHLTRPKKKSKPKKRSQMNMIKKPLGLCQKQTKRISIRLLKTVRLWPIHFRCNRLVC